MDEINWLHDESCVEVQSRHGINAVVATETDECEMEIAVWRDNCHGNCLNDWKQTC